jgi:hypothetical protein
VRSLLGASSTRYVKSNRDPDVARLATFCLPLPRLLLRWAVVTDIKNLGQAETFLPGPCAPYFKLMICVETVFVSGFAVNRTTAFT